MEKKNEFHTNAFIELDFELIPHPLYSLNLKWKKSSKFNSVILHEIRFFFFFFLFAATAKFLARFKWLSNVNNASILKFSLEEFKGYWHFLHYYIIKWNVILYHKDFPDLSNHSRMYEIQYTITYYLLLININ